MFNKSYEKGSKNIRKILKIQIVILLVILLANEIPIKNYYIIIGGGINLISYRIIIDSQEVERNDNFYMSYVSQIDANLLFSTISLFKSSWKLEKVENSTDEQILNYILLDNSIDNSIISAYDLSDKDINITNIKYIVAYIDPLAVTDLIIGDILLEVNGIEFNSFLGYKELIETFDIGDKLNLKVKSNDKIVNKSIEVIDIEGQKITGLAFISNYEYETNPSVEINFSNNESGSSAGLMMAINLYEIISNKDISRNRKIVGTGGITEQGLVYPVGGVEYKFKAAVDAKADVFIVPNDTNYDEVMEVQNKYNYDIEIIGVDSLKEAIEKLLYN